MTIAPATFRVADPERRFRAFVVDRAIAWTPFALAGAAAWWWFFRDGKVGAGIGLIAGVVILVSLLFIVLLGASGVSPGRALFGLRVVDVDTGEPIGLGRALGRTTILGIGSLPMFGLGVATLAWTAVEDRTGARRGWHDQTARSVVVDIRPVPVDEEQADDRPRHVVNLTAMRLKPVKETGAESAPVSAPDHSGPQSIPSQPSTARPQPSGSSEPHPAAQSWGPPSTPPVAPARPPEPAPPRQPAPEAQATPQPSPVAQARPAAAAGVDPSTSAVRRPTAALPRWRLEFDSGEGFEVEGLGLVGRAPAARQGEAVRHLVPLSSGDMSISKTHAQFHLATDGALVIMDRGSTNGSLLIRKGVTRELSPGRPATLVEGDRVRFGDREMRVTKQQS